VISEEDIRRVRDSIDLTELVSETVVLKRKGRLFWGRCPFHAEKTPSFKVDPATQLWHCFGCGLGGDAFGFVMRTENVDFPDAVRELAERAHVEIHETAGGPAPGLRDRLTGACEAAAGAYQRVLLKSQDPGAQKARAYLAERGFGSDVAKKFGLGYAPGRGALVRELGLAGFSESELVDANLALRSDSGQLRDRFYERIMFPIRDVQGRCVGFGGRALGAAEPKYLNTQETPAFHKSRNLYNIDRARNEIVRAGTAIVVEGYTDVIALVEAGVANVVATLGTALTREHMKLLGRFAKHVVYLFDGDEAGLRAADRAVEFIGFDITPEAGTERIDLDVAVIPGGRDPADFVAEEGEAALRALVRDAVPLVQFALDRRLARHDLTRPEGRTAALRDAAQVLTAVRGSLLAHDYTNYLADRLMVDFNTVQQAVLSAKATPVQTEEESGTAGTGPSTANVPQTPQTRAERELIGVLVKTPTLRPEARFLLSDDLLTDPMHERIVEHLVGHPSESIPELVASLEPVDSGAAAVVAGLSVNGDVLEDADSLADELFRKLKEFSLDRQILAKKTELRSLDAAAQKERYDQLFQEIAQLQLERARVRSGVQENVDTEA